MDRSFRRSLIGAITASVGPRTAITVPFVLVRVQAKLEAPLSALRGHGGAAAISTIAEVTFYGHDQAGRETSVKGFVSVNFADGNLLVTMAMVLGGVGEAATAS